jgi:hypothetical protein
VPGENQDPRPDPLHAPVFVWRLRGAPALTAESDVPHVLRSGSHTRTPHARTNEQMHVPCIYIAYHSTLTRDK